MSQQRVSSAPELVQLTLFPVASPVNHSATRDKSAVSLTTVISGRKCLGSYERSGPLGYLVRTLVASSLWHSTTWRLVWKVKATKSRRSYFRLVASALPTCDNAALSWPTPRAAGCMAHALRSPENIVNGNPRGRLEDAVAIAMQVWPTPTARDWKDVGDVQAPVNGQLGRADGPAKLSGSLNPQWVEWLQGFPPGWTDLEHSETP